MTEEAAQPGGAASTEPPPPPPPPPYEPPPADPPPWQGTAGTPGDRPSFQRDKLIRPLRPRYVAGVSGALGNATNTDPVLWRVLLAVLSLTGGVGVLIYLIGWLFIASEGDTASPVEALFGRGRSAMKPMSIVLLGGATVLTFAFVMHDGFRAALLAVAVLVGAAMLLKRNNPALFSGLAAAASGSRPAPAPAPPAADDPTARFTTTAPAASTDPATAPAGTTEPTSTEPTATEPAGTEPTGTPAAGTEPTGTRATGTQAAGAGPAEPVTEPLPPRPPSFEPPTGGYRPPFAPHGPWAQQAPPPPPPPPVRHPKKPRPPKEKSRLGSITFSMMILVLGCLALTDLAGASVPVSAYFAAALATIAIGLIVGAWFGRSRALIGLALLVTLGLAVSTGIERVGGRIGGTVYRPTSIAAVPERYDVQFGKAVLDLRRVDFNGADQTTTVEMKFGQIQVLLPPNVDTTADVNMNEGLAVVFGRRYDAREAGAQPFTDLGTDGAGGGTLRLNIVMNTGNVEVIR